MSDIIEELIKFAETGAIPEVVDEAIAEIEKLRSGLGYTNVNDGMPVPGKFMGLEIDVSANDDVLLLREESLDNMIIVGCGLRLIINDAQLCSLTECIKDWFDLHDKDHADIAALALLCKSRFRPCKK